MTSQPNILFLNDIYGRPPFESGPIWDKNGIVNPVWLRWFNGIFAAMNQVTNTQSAESITDQLTQRQGITADSVMITVLGLLLTMQHPRVLEQDPDYAPVLAGRSEGQTAIDYSGLLRACGPQRGDNIDITALLINRPTKTVIPTTLIIDSLANWTLTNYNPAFLQIGQQILITDYNVTYVVSSANTWVYDNGEYIGTGPPTVSFNGAAFGSADEFFRWTDTTLLQQWYWSGSAWVMYPHVPISATVLSSNANADIIAASLASGEIWVGSAGNLPVAVTLSGDAVVSPTGVVTTAGISGTAVLAKLTTAGSNGSLTYADGLITSYTAPT